MSRKQNLNDPISKHQVLTLRVSVTQGRGTHVTQPDGPFAAAVDKYIALVWVKFSSGDDFRQLFHVSRLDIHNVWSTVLRRSAWPIRLATPNQVSETQRNHGVYSRDQTLRRLTKHTVF